MASSKTAKQFIEIIDGKWYAIVLGLTSAIDNVNFEEIGSVTVRLGKAEKVFDLINGDGYRYLLIQAEVDDDNDKFIEILASDDLVNAFFIINDSQQFALSVRECSDTNLVTNGEFTGNANNWVLGNNWTYNDNNILHTTGSGNVTQAITATTGNPHVIFIEIDCAIPGSSSINLNFGNGSWVPYLRASEITYINEVIGSNHTLTIGPATNTTIDNVVIREITGIDLVDPNNWDLGVGWRASGNSLIFTYLLRNGDMAYQEVSGVVAGLTYHLSLSINGFFQDDEINVRFGYIGTDHTISPADGDISFDIIATEEDAEYPYVVFEYEQDIRYIEIRNVSLKLKTGDVFGPELIVNGNFNGNASGWDGETGTQWVRYGGNDFLLYKPDTWGSLIQSGLSITPGIEYKLKFKINNIETLGISGPGTINVIQGTQEILIVTDSQTGAISTSFTADNSGNSISFLPNGYITDVDIDNISLKEILHPSVDDNIPIKEFLSGNTDEGQEIFFRVDTLIIQIQPSMQMYSNPLAVVTDLEAGTQMKTFVSLDDKPFYQLEGTNTKGVSILKFNARSDEEKKPPLIQSIQVSYRDSSKNLCKITQMAIITLPTTIDYSQ